MSSCANPVIVADMPSSESQIRRPAAMGNFQAGQTAKARLGLPCAVTPKKDVAAGDLSNHETIVNNCSKVFHPWNSVEIES
jgi:hypothetical protein